LDARQQKVEELVDPLSARIIAHVVEVLPCENFDDLLAESAGVEEGVIDFYLVFAVYLLLLHEVNHKN
jgi:hypothetical protein